MARILSLLLWSVVFCAALLLIDLIFVHVPLSAPGLTESQRFYRDFRQRLLTLRTPAPPAPSIEALIEQNTAAVPPAPATTKPQPQPPEPVEPASTPATAVAPPQSVKPTPLPTVAAPKTKAAPVTTATATLPARGATGAAAAPRKSAAGKSSGYVYADGEGELHFVDRLEQVPARYRREAQPLDN